MGNAAIGDNGGKYQGYSPLATSARSRGIYAWKISVDIGPHANGTTKSRRSRAIWRWLSEAFVPFLFHGLPTTALAVLRDILTSRAPPSDQAI